MNSRGFTLLEIVITIVVLAIGVTAFIQLMNSATIGSIDPMVRQQAHAVAKSYLEEVMLNPFCDPDLSTDCPTFCTGANICTNCSENTGGAENRASFDDICDYNGLSNTGARDQFNNSISGLENYNVTVTVDDAGVVLDSAGATGPLSSAAGQVVRIDVNVTHASNPDVDITFSAYRVNY